MLFKEFMFECYFVTILCSGEVSCTVYGCPIHDRFFAEVSLEDEEDLIISARELSTLKSEFEGIVSSYQDHREVEIEPSQMVAIGAHAGPSQATPPR